LQVSQPSQETSLAASSPYTTPQAEQVFSSTCPPPAVAQVEGSVARRAASCSALEA
jgi:hypothetical protein